MTVAPGATATLLAPWAVVVDAASGDGIVVDRFAHAAVRLDVDGAVIWRTDGLAHSPCAAEITGDGRVLVATHLGGSLEVLDATTGTRRPSVAIPPLAVAVSGIDDDVAVAGLDLTFVASARSVNLSAPATSIALVDGALLVGTANGVDRVDAGGRRCALFAGDGPQIVARGGPWVADHRAGECRVFDDGGSAVASVAVEGHPWHAAVAGGLLFAVAPFEDAVTVIDAVTGERVAVLRVPRPWGVDFDVARGNLWITSPLEGAVRVVEVAAPRRPTAG